MTVDSDLSFSRPFCDNSSSPITATGEILPTSPHVSSLFHLLSSDYILSSVFKIAPEVVKSTIIHVVSYVTGLDNEDSVCIWKFILAATPILLLSLVASLLYSFVPSFLIQYGFKVVEIAMIVDYIIFPLLIPLGSNWPAILLLLINYAIYISLDQCDNKIRWSDQQKISSKRMIILYVAYPIIMIVASYFIAKCIVYDAYYYARLYHMI